MGDNSNTMNWKEFFKPDLLKIIIFLILLVVLLFMPIIQGISVSPCQIPPCPEEKIAYTMFQLLFQRSGYDLFYQYTLINSLVYISLIIMSCIISCSVYRILKNKKFFP